MIVRAKLVPVHVIKKLFDRSVSKKKKKKKRTTSLRAFIEDQTKPIKGKPKSITPT